MKNTLKTLRTFYFITLLSPIFVIAVYRLSVEEGTVMLNSSMDSILKYLIPIFGIVFIAVGFLVFRMRLAAVLKEQSNELKIQAYKGIVIMRIAFIEGVAVFASVAFIITLNNLYVAYTLIALSFFIPLFPTEVKIKKDLGLKADSIDENATKTSKTNYLTKNPWLILPIIAVMVLMNYNSFKEFLSNKVVLPNEQVDNGTIVDSVYHNEYLDWTMVIPEGYNKIPLAQIKEDARRGNELLKRGSSGKTNPIRLLDISNGDVTFKSSLAPRGMYPNLYNEDDYLVKVNELYGELKNDSIVLEKRNQGVIPVDSLEFKYVEYIKRKGEKSMGILIITKFNEDFILDVSLSFINSDQAIALLKNFVNSDFNWE